MRTREASDWLFIYLIVSCLKWGRGGGVPMLIQASKFGSAVSKYGSHLNRHRELPYNRHAEGKAQPPCWWAGRSPTAASRTPPLHGGLWWRLNCYYIDHSFGWTSFVGFSTNLSISNTEYSVFFYVLFSQLSPWFPEIKQTKYKRNQVILNKIW